MRSLKWYFWAKNGHSAEIYVKFENSHGEIREYLADELEKFNKVLERTKAYFCLTKNELGEILIETERTRIDWR